MPARRNKRAGVEDRWFKTVVVVDADTGAKKTVRTESAQHGIWKRWRARYVDEFSREHSKSFDRKTDAQAWLNTVVSQQVTGEYVDPAKSATLFGVVAEQWFATKATRKPKTVAGYRSLLDTLVLPTWSNARLADIEYETIQVWLNSLSNRGHRFPDRGLSPSRVIQAYQVLDQVLRYAIRSKRLAHNPAQGVELPRKSEPERRYLTHAQLQKLAEASGDRAVLVLVLGYCGLRFGEATALRVKDFDPIRRRLHVRRSATAVTKLGIVEGPTKNHLSRSVPIPEFVADRLTRQVESKDTDSLIFPSRNGGYLSLGELRWPFDKAAQQTGLDGLVPHELRHTAASLAIAAGANVKVVQRMLGHKTATLTMDLYGHLYADDLDAVAVALNIAANASSAQH